MPPKSQKGKDSTTSRASKAAKNNEGDKVERLIVGKKKDRRTKKGSGVDGTTPAEPSRRSEQTRGKRQRETSSDNPSEDETSDYYSASNQEESDTEPKTSNEGRMEIAEDDNPIPETLTPASASASSPSSFDTPRGDQAVRALDLPNAYTPLAYPTTPLNLRSRPSMFIPGSFNQDAFTTPRPQCHGALSSIGPSIEVPIVSMVNGTPMMLKPDNSRAPVTPDNIIKLWASEADKYRKERERLAAAQDSPSGTASSTQIEEIVPDDLINSLNANYQDPPTPDPENNGGQGDGALDNVPPSLPQPSTSPPLDTGVKRHSRCITKSNRKVKSSQHT
ncbi:hypothetical protein PQX77_008714, partial [Marasmius sp. AFHP31]